MSSLTDAWDAIPAGDPQSAALTKAAASAPASSLVAAWDAVPVTAPKGKVTWQAEDNGLTPASQPSAIASFGAAAGKGFGDMVLGGQQLIGKGLQAISPDGSTVNNAGQWLANDAAQGVAKLDNEDAPYAAANPKSSFFGTITGSLPAAFIPVGKVAEGTNLVGRLIAGAKSGALGGMAAGALQPVTDQDSNYWLQKGTQTATGGIIGGIAQPVVGGAVRALGGAANSALNAARPLVSKLTGSSEPIAAYFSNASPEFKQAVQTAAAQGKRVNPEALSRQVEADSLPVPMSLTPGQATQNPMQVSMEMNLRSKNPAMVQKLNDQNNQLIQNLDHVRDTGAPDAIAPDHITAGETLINSAKNVLDAQDAKTSALYKQLQDANGGSLPLDGQSFAIKANEALGQNMKGAFLPPQVQGILEKFQTGEQPMTFENFENLRTILGAAARGATDGNTRGAINTVRDTLENMPMTSDTEGVKAIADAARASAKQGFDLVRNNPSLAAIDSGKAVADNFVQKHVINASKENLVNLATALKDDPVALQTMKAGVVNYLKHQAVGQTGNFSQSGYNKGLQALGPKLDVLFSPEEAQTLRTVGSVAKNIQLQPKGSFVNNSNTDVSNLARQGSGMVAGALDRATGTPIGSVLHGLASDAINKKAAANQLRELLSPLAGVTSPSKAEIMVNQHLPVIGGKIGSIPLSAIAAQRSSTTPSK